jgi:arylsulfatase A-like enzyme
MRFFVLMLLALGLFGCSPKAVEGEFPRLGRGVLVIEVEAWRRDHLGLYGYDKATSPFLENLAGRVIVFDNAWSTGADAMPAAVSLLTGCDPIVARRPGIELADGSVLDPAYPWDVTERVPRVAFQFLLDGYRTCLLGGDGALENLRGLRLGFENVRWPERNAKGGVQERDLAELGSELLDWTHSLKAGQDWFAYLEVSDLEHFHRGGKVASGFEYKKGLDFVPPVGPSEPVFHALPRSRVTPDLETMADYVGAYDSALAQLDSDLRHLFASLGKQNLLSRTTIVLVGGYGMGFGEAGLLAEAGTLSEVDLAVPLLIRPAPELEMPVGQRISAVVSLVDVGPTLMHMHQVQMPSDLAGRSMAGLMVGKTDKIREHAFAIGDIHAGYAVIDESGMLIHSWPQIGGPPGLGMSWFGRDDVGDQATELLLPRGAGLLPNAYRGGVDNPAWADRLRAAGHAWSQEGKLLRDLNFESPVSTRRVEASVGEADQAKPSSLLKGE